MTQEQKWNELGELIDSLESLSVSLNMGVPDSLHVSLMKSILPQKVEAFKDIFYQLSGYNPWE